MIIELDEIIKLNTSNRDVAVATELKKQLE